MPISSQWFRPGDYALALPMIILAVFGCGILIIDLGLPQNWKKGNVWIALEGLAFSGISVYRIYFHFHQASAISSTLAAPPPEAFGGALVMDSFSLFFFTLFLVAAAITVLVSSHYLEVENENHGEYYALILFSVVGMMCMAAGNDLILQFIGLELMAISTYILVGFLRNDRRSNEAALKYLLLGAFSSGIFAYGLSLFYGLTGSTNLKVISESLNGQLFNAPHHPIIILALVTTAAGLFFKIAAAPFHQWAPDAYEGAPTSITGFISVAGKAAAWALLLRIFLTGLNSLRPLYVPLVVFVALASLTGGNLAALTQSNLKRLFAYSSIAHVGYMLLGLVAGDSTHTSPTGIKGILIYLMVYTFMNLGVFAVITSLRRRNIIGDEIDDISGLYYKAPVSAVLMLIFLLSLGGIPPLAGFYGKYFIFLSLIETGHFALASLAIVYVAVAVYYYLRIANAMFMGEAVDDTPVQVSPGLVTALALAGVATVYIGIFPERFINAATQSIPHTSFLLR